MPKVVPIMMKGGLVSAPKNTDRRPKQFSVEHDYRQNGRIRAPEPMRETDVVGTALAYAVSRVDECTTNRRIPKVTSVHPMTAQLWLTVVLEKQTDQWCSTNEPRGCMNQSKPVWSIEGRSIHWRTTVGWHFRLGNGGGGGKAREVRGG